jgi:hypothetical protein
MTNATDEPLSCRVSPITLPTCTRLVAGPLQTALSSRCLSCAPVGDFTGWESVYQDGRGQQGRVADDTSSASKHRALFSCLPCVARARGVVRVSGKVTLAGIPVLRALYNATVRCHAGAEHTPASTIEYTSHENIPLRRNTRKHPW